MAHHNQKPLTIKTGSAMTIKTADGDKIITGRQLECFLEAREHWKDNGYADYCKWYKKLKGE